MIIRLDSKLFTSDPDVRFANEQKLPRGFWNELWRRYKFLEYTTSDLKQYYDLKSGKKCSTTTIARWIFRSEIYHKAQPFVKKGVITASTEIFGELEERLINELTKQYRAGVSRRNRIII